MPTDTKKSRISRSGVYLERFSDKRRKRSHYREAHDDEKEACRRLVEQSRGAIGLNDESYVRHRGFPVISILRETDPT